MVRRIRYIHLRSADGKSRNEKGNETGKGTEVDPGVINQTKSDVFRRIRGRTTSLWDFFQNRKRCKKAAGKQIELRLVSGKKNSCVNHRIKDDIVAAVPAENRSHGTNGVERNFIT